MREAKAMITFNDAQYMVANENFSAKQSIPSSNECMTKADVNTYLLHESELSDYSDNQLVPYHKISPHFWQFLSSYYRLEETSGAVVDAKGYKNITVSNDVGRVVDGIIGNAHDFRNAGMVAGNEGYYNFSENGTNNPTSFVAWVKFTSTADAPIVNNMYRDSRWTFMFEISGGNLAIRVKGGTDESTNSNYIGRIASNFDFKLNQWQLIGFSYDGGNTNSALKIYQNATRVDDANFNAGSFGSTALNSSVSVKFFYGQHDVGEPFYFTGYADEVIFFLKYSLTQADFDYLYNDGTGRILSPPA